MTVLHLGQKNFVPFSLGIIGVRHEVQSGRAILSVFTLSTIVNYSIYCYKNPSNELRRYNGMSLSAAPTWSSKSACFKLLPRP